MRLLAEIDPSEGRRLRSGGRGSSETYGFRGFLL